MIVGPGINETSLRPATQKVKGGPANYSRAWGGARGRPEPVQGGHANNGKAALGNVRCHCCLEPNWRGGVQ